MPVRQVKHLFTANQTPLWLRQPFPIGYVRYDSLFICVRWLYLEHPKGAMEHKLIYLHRESNYLMNMTCLQYLVAHVTQPYRQARIAGKMFIDISHG